MAVIREKKLNRKNIIDRIDIAIIKSINLIKIMSSVKIPSVCIPRVHVSMNAEGVSTVFNEVFNMNLVHHVDMVQRTDRNTEQVFYVAYVHFNEVKGKANIEKFNELGGDKFVEKINNDLEIRLVYRDPWFWKLRRNTKSKHVRRPRILNEEDEAAFMEHQKKVLLKRRGGEAEIHPEENNDAENTEED